MLIYQKEHSVEAAKEWWVGQWCKRKVFIFYSKKINRKYLKPKKSR